MKGRNFERLLRRGLLRSDELDKIESEAAASGVFVEDLLISKGIPKHEILLSLSEHSGLPFVEYDEGVVVSPDIMRKIDAERLKSALWLPVSIVDGKAEVIAHDPANLALTEDIRKTLGVEEIKFVEALPGDLVRIIEHNQDLNRRFPPSAGRTPLAVSRTFLADRRTCLSRQRTAMAKGRTGLSFIRTGIAFITISVALYRLFGFGYLSVLSLPLLVGGGVAVFDGLKWYLSVRPAAKARIDYPETGPSGENTVLEVKNLGDNPVFRRTSKIEGCGELREGWNSLSPVQRRRFLANDRTDMAEERTLLAGLRTRMAKARTGLAFTRTGIAFAGLGIGLLRHFKSGPWTAFDLALIITGTAMTLEGFLWYIPGRSAGKEGLKTVSKAMEEKNIWDFVFPPFYKSGDFYACLLSVKDAGSPGIWATTGLALERTVLAERRNLMARLRTIMARARTGMAFIRTGLSMSAVGAGLMIFFGTGNAAWTVFDIALTAVGAVLVADGLWWFTPAERTRRQLPYCFGDMEINIPDYAVPPRYWNKVVFSHDDF